MSTHEQRTAPTDGSARQPGQLWAAVPYKGPVGGKRRLAGLLGTRERALLAAAMLEDVLDALLAAPSVAAVAVVAPPGTFPTGRGDPRLRMIDDPTAGGPGGLDRAVRLAQQAALDGGADRLLVVPADLPLLRPGDVVALADAGLAADVVLAPDRLGDGTNALLLRPPDALGPAFGPGSFRRHRLRAEAAGLTCTVVERPALALDLDTPADLARLLDTAAEGRAPRLLQRWGIAGRLSELAAAQARSTTT